MNVEGMLNDDVDDSVQLEDNVAYSVEDAMEVQTPCVPAINVSDPTPPQSPAEPAGGRTSMSAMSPLPPLASLPSVKDIPRALQELTELLPQAWNTRFGSPARYVGEALGGEQADTHWAWLAAHPECVARARTKVVLPVPSSLTRQLPMVDRQTEELIDDLLTPGFPTLRKRAESLGRFANAGTAAGLDVIRRWDASVFPSPERIELDCLSSLALEAYRIRQLPMEPELYVCCVCMWTSDEVASPAEQLVRQTNLQLFFSPAVLPLHMWPLRHQERNTRIGSDITNMSKLEEVVRAGLLSCHVCRQQLDWPWSAGPPFLQLARGEAGGSSGA